MTNLDSILKSRDIALSKKIRLVKAMVFPVVMYAPSSRKPFLPLPPPALARVHTHTHSFSIQESFLRPWEEPRNVFTWLCFFIKFSKVKYILYFFPLNNTLPTFQAVSSGPMKAVLPLPETHLVFNTELN